MNRTAVITSLGVAAGHVSASGTPRLGRAGGGAKHLQRLWIVSLLLLTFIPARAAFAESLKNIALSSLGTEIVASDSLGGDMPEKLIDGLVNYTLEHRWHSDINAGCPHWLRLQFPKALSVQRLVFHASSVACFPTRLV